MSHDNTKKLWFKRRRYGWGWVPVTWQGVVCIVIYALIIFAAALQLPNDESVTSGQLMVFFGIVFAASVGLVIVSRIKGPKPYWRWGTTSDDNPKEDF